MALPVTFPTNLPRDFERVRGAAELYVANYVAGGAAVSNVHYLGQVDEGGFGIQLTRNYTEVEGEEELEASSDILVKEQTLVKCTLQQSPVDVLALILGSAVTLSTGGGVSAIDAADVTTIAAVSASPISVAPKSPIVDSAGSTADMPPIMRSVMNQNPIAEMVPATARPLYSAFMIFPPGTALTK